MKKTLSTILILFGALTLWAQNDSLVLCLASWQTEQIQGIKYQWVHFNNHDYFNSNQYLAFLEIPKEECNRVSYAYEPTRTRTSTMAKKHAATAAINGSFFDMDKHNPVCYLRIDGQEVGINEPGVDTVNRKYYQYGTLVLDSGRVFILHTDSARFWERTLPYRNIMTAGPLLIYEGKRIPQRNDLSFVNKRHNRTAVGIRPDGTIILLIADGRSREAEGMTLDELQNTLYWLGCDYALNLDGGGSTTLYLQGREDNGVVNHPSDNGHYDHKGERGVSNVILIEGEKR